MSAPLRRLPSLTSLRYLFALGVVAEHLIPIWAQKSYSAWPAWLHNLLNASLLALPFFFALSGFVLFYTYRLDPPRSGASRFHFWRKRFARIAPVFYLSLLLGASSLIAEKGYGELGTGEGIKLFGLNLVFLSAWKPAALIFNFSTWSISVEVFCYLLFPLLLPWFLAISRKAALLGMAACFGVGALIQVGGALHWPALWTWPWQVNDVPAEVAVLFEVHPLVHFPEFLFGVFLARLWEQRDPASDRFGDLILASGFLLIALFLVSGIPWPFLMLTSFLPLPFIGLLLWGAAAPRGRWLAWVERPAAHVLGESSYAVYVFHMPLSYWFAMTVSTSGRPYLMFGLFVVALTALSVTVHQFFELPLRRWISGGRRAD